jgi:hypothetical protein
MVPKVSNPFLTKNTKLFSVRPLFYVQYKRCLPKEDEAEEVAEDEGGAEEDEKFEEAEEEEEDEDNVATKMLFGEKGKIRAAVSQAPKK